MYRKRIIAKIIGSLGFVIVAFNCILKIQNENPITIINRTDGPTSVFLAGKIGKDSPNASMSKRIFAKCFLSFQSQNRRLFPIRIIQIIFMPHSRNGISELALS